MKRGEISFNILDREKYGRTYIGKDVYLTRKLSASLRLFEWTFRINAEEFKWNWVRDAISTAWTNWMHGTLKSDKITLMQYGNVSKTIIHACMYVCVSRAMTEVWLKWDVHRIMKFVCINAGFSFPFYCLLDCSALFLSLYGQIWQKFSTDHAPRLKSFGKCGNDYRLLHAYRYRKKRYILFLSFLLKWILPHFNFSFLCLACLAVSCRGYTLHDWQ